MEAKRDSGLTPKQDRFCREYVTDLNATGAARRAGYSEKTAHVQGPRLLENVRVASRIAELQGQAAKRIELTTDEVLLMLLDSYRDAKAANQHGPAVRAAELLGKHLGAFTDRMILSEEQSATDEDLIKALGAGDKTKERVLREVFVPDGFTSLRIQAIEGFGFTQGLLSLKTVNSIGYPSCRITDSPLVPQSCLPLLHHRHEGWTVAFRPASIAEQSRCFTGYFF